MRFLVLAVLGLVLMSCGGDDDGRADPSDAGSTGDASRPDPDGDSDAGEPVDAGSCGPGCEACRAFYTRAGECAPALVTPQQLAMVLTDCLTDPGWGATVGGWSAEFATPVASCFETIPCIDVENMDDLCIPVGLTAANRGQLDPALLEVCGGADGSSAMCRSMILEDGAGDAGVVSSCLEMWAGCDGMFGSEYWTEDHCLSLWALMPAARTAAEPCLSMQCPAAKGCLEAAGAFGF